MIYRAHANLSFEDGPNVKKGEVFSGKRLTEKNAAVLIDLGKISLASTPPLTEVPRWKTRAGKLAKEDIVTVSDFLEKDEEELAKILDQNVKAIEAMKKNLAGWIAVPQPKG